MRATSPRPYTRTQLKALWAALDARWPKLPPDESERWLERWRDGRSPYVRVRSHAIRLQLEAIIVLALRCGLRRHEIRALDEDSMHYDNAYIVVWADGAPWHGDSRTVPFTESARSAVRDWLDFRAVVQPDHDYPWLNLWSVQTVRDPVRAYTFDRLLRTYVGEGWTLKRLRDTCAVSWVRAGLPLEHLRQILGLKSLEAVLPYLALVGGDVGRRMQRLDQAFSEAVRPAQSAA